MFENLASALRKQNYPLRKTRKNFQKKIFLCKNYQKKKKEQKNEKIFKKKKKKILKKFFCGDCGRCG
jgi:hypothetical protein